MLIEDIKIFPCFITHPPRPEKMERKEAHYRNTGSFQSEIVLDAAGHLIDGYTSYLLALKYGVASVNVRYGGRQIVKAYHKIGGKLYVWELPGLLVDHVNIGDKLLVPTKKGPQIVTVAAVEEYAGQEQKRLRMVYKKLKKVSDRQQSLL